MYVWRLPYTFRGVSRPSNVEGGVRGVRKPQNRSEIRKKTAIPHQNLPKYRNRSYKMWNMPWSKTSSGHPISCRHSNQHYISFNIFRRRIYNNWKSTWVSPLKQSHGLVSGENVQFSQSEFLLPGETSPSFQSLLEVTWYLPAHPQPPLHHCFRQSRLPRLHPSRFSPGSAVCRIALLVKVNGHRLLWDLAIPLLFGT